MDSTERAYPGRYWHRGSDGRVACDLCPRACQLREGQRAFCFVRENRDGQMVLSTWGKSTGFCIDPIEKKPLNHFLPGTPVLSFGTAGCNLGCKFCQNWETSKSREVAAMSQKATPLGIARAALDTGCRSVAFTYNDPVVWAEYAIDTAHACREHGIHTVAVTAGYITETARGEFFDAIDAANVDLKAFNQQFYRKLCFAHLEPVLETLLWLKSETDVWFEVTTLLIEGHNDSAAELHALTDWFAEHLGPQVPLHFTAFHPDFRMQTPGRTRLGILRRAVAIAREKGLHYVYTGNVHDPDGDATRCPSCQSVVIQRSWYELQRWNLDADGGCGSCGARISGVFESSPGEWGGRRQRVLIHR